MKKRVLAAILAALTIAAVSVTAVGCGSAPAETEKTETSQVEDSAKEDKEEKANEKEEEKQTSNTTKKKRDISNVKFGSCKVDEVTYSAPTKWEKEETPSTAIFENYALYYPEGKSDTEFKPQINIHSIRLEKYFTKLSDAESYLKNYATQHFSSTTNIEFSEYKKSGVPALKMTGDLSTDYTIEAYCYLYTPEHDIKISGISRFLTIYYVNDKNGTDYMPEFEKMVKSIKTPKLEVTSTEEAEGIEELKENQQEAWEESQKKSVAPRIGMTKEQVRSGMWGSPDRINKDEYEWGTEEQWVYNSRGYIYFENGIVTAIQHR